MLIGQPELQKGHSILETALSVVLVVAVPGLLLYFLHIKAAKQIERQTCISVLVSCHSHSHREIYHWSNIGLHTRSQQCSACRLNTQFVTSVTSYICTEVGRETN